MECASCGRGNPAAARFCGGRLVGLEMFEPEDLELARARFDELRAAKV